MYFQGFQRRSVVVMFYVPGSLAERGPLVQALAPLLVDLLWESSALSAFSPTTTAVAPPECAQVWLKILLQDMWRHITWLRIWKDNDDTAQTGSYLQSFPWYVYLKKETWTYSLKFSFLVSDSWQTSAYFFNLGIHKCRTHALQTATHLQAVFLDHRVWAVWMSVIGQPCLMRCVLDD